MPQGALKARKPSGAPQKHSAKQSGKVSKGQRSFKAKKQDAKIHAKVTKKHTASLTAATEKLLASRVGHLEILKGTRKEVEAKQAAKTKK